MNTADDPAESQAYDLGFSVGRTMRTFTSPNPKVAVGILLTVFVGVIGSAIVGLLPERTRIWYVVGLGAFVLVGTGYGAIRYRNLPLFAAGLYVAATDIGIGARELEDARWAMWIVAAATIAGGLIFMRSVVRSVRSEKELEKVINTDATSIAFFAVMLAALTYALLETYVDLPRISMWLVWSVGMGTWAVMSFVVRRRLT
jgi:hypothetical protein